MQMQTLSGHTIDTDEPDPQLIHVTDVARQLSNLHMHQNSKYFFSFAQHCTELSKRVTPDAALQALFHHGSVAYLGPLHYLGALNDVMTDEYKEKKKRMDAAIQFILVDVFNAYPIDDDTMMHIVQMEKDLILEEEFLGTRECRFRAHMPHRAYADFLERFVNLTE